MCQVDAEGRSATQIPLAGRRTWLRALAINLVDISIDTHIKCRSLELPLWTRIDRAHHMGVDTTGCGRALAMRP